MKIFKGSSSLLVVLVVFLVILISLLANTVFGANTMYQNQSNHVNLRFGMFIHFNMGTFHDAEWVNPGQDPLSFNPTNLDCNQWAAAAKSAKMTYAVLTTKHHDGFCLWPSAYTTYDVMSSSYPHDIVQQYVDAFRAQGLTPCFYFSIWDRQQGIESGSVSAADIAFVKNQLTELLSNYGPIPLLVIDGWAWQMGHKQVPYGEIRDHIKSLQPDCLIVDHNGLTQPWDEDIVYYEEPKGSAYFCPSGNIYASCQGQTICNGWFWHPSTPTATLMSVSSIVNDHILVLESRYCNFLLNCPPNNQGLLDTNIVNRLAQVGAQWSGPNTSRAPLPAQPDVLLYPITPVSASATSGTANNAIDGISDNLGGTQTLWQSSSSLPQSVTADLGKIYNNIDMITYLPRQDSSTTGNITSYRLYVSTDNTNFTQVASGTWAADKVMKRVKFTPSNARYVRLEVVAANGGYGIVSEFDIGGFANKPIGPTSTPTPTATPIPGGTNAVLNKTATANAYWGTESPDKAVDGTTANNSKWCTDANPGAQWLQVDIGQVCTMNRWVVKHAGAGGESATLNTKDFKLQKSSDGSTWVDVDAVTGNTANITDRNVTSFTSRYVRLYVTVPTQTTDQHSRIYELEVYTAAGATATPTPTPATTATPTPTPAITATPTPTGGIVSGATYKIIARHSSKLAGVSGGSTADAAEVVQQTDSGANYQKWVITDLGTGYYKIINVNSNKSLDINGASTADGAKAIQWPYGGANNQQWQIVDLGAGYYKIVARHSGKALDVNGASTADGANIIQWTWSGSNNQQWQLLKQ